MQQPASIIEEIESIPNRQGTSMFTGAVSGDEAGAGAVVDFRPYQRQSVLGGGDGDVLIRVAPKRGTLAQGGSSRVICLGGGRGGERCGDMR